MSGQLLPPQELTTPLPASLTREECVLLWLDHMEACEELLLAGLRRESESDDELRDKYRDWYQRTMEDHDRAMFRMVERFNALADEA